MTKNENIYKVVARTRIGYPWYVYAIKEDDGNQWWVHRHRQSELPLHMALEVVSDMEGEDERLVVCASTGKVCGYISATRYPSCSKRYMGMLDENKQWGNLFTTF